jgi:hypothetical protein
MARSTTPCSTCTRAASCRPPRSASCPLKYAFTDDPQRRFGIDFLEQELLEFSWCVPVPANAEALVEGRAAGIDQVAPLLDWAVDKDGIDAEAFETVKGEIADLDKRIVRAEEVIKLKASLAKPVEPTIAARATLPAQARTRYSKLKAFKGESAEEDAYAVGKWSQAILFGDEEARAWCKEHGVAITKAQSEGVNSAGGFLVPAPMMNAIIDLRETFGIFRRNTLVVPMSSDSLAWPRRTGGLTAYFVGEGIPPRPRARRPGTTSTWRPRSSPR